MTDLGRVITAMVTPFAPDLEVDYGRARELARRLVDDGSDGLVVCGTTGEAPTLTEAERLRLFETVVAEVGGQAAVIAGVGTNNTAATVAFARKAAGTGVAALLVVTPYYNRPPQEGLYRHFRAVAEAAPLPVVLYNVPARTGVNMLPETVVRLARDVPNIVALKDASGGVEAAGRVARAAPAGFRVLCGDDALTLPTLAVGASGVISVASHLVGGRLRRMIDDFERGDVAAARRVHLELLPLFSALFVTANPIPVKRALALAGFPVGGVRPPLEPAGAAEDAALTAAMGPLGLLARG